MSILFLVITAIMLYLTVQAFQIWQSSKQWIALICAAVALGIAYDNLIVGIGMWVGEGSLLQSLNLPRYVFHAILTPMMAIFGFGLLRRAGIKWAQSPIAMAIVCLVATALIALGLYTDVFAGTLHLANEFGTLRYGSDSPIPGPPIPAVLTIVILMVCGLVLAIQRKWWYLLLGAVVMFVAAGAGAGIFWIANLGEVLLTYTNVESAKRWIK
ncbi:MAG TPA: hypothetical protein PK299_12575 [Anaerolineales bacterium]|nr:hypothetical protein [Anaerolineales bacterium]